MNTEAKIKSLVGGNPRYETTFDSCTCHNARKTGGDYKIWLGGDVKRVCKHRLVLFFHRACLIIGKLQKQIAQRDQRIKELEYKITDLECKIKGVA